MRPSPNRGVCLDEPLSPELALVDPELALRARALLPETFGPRAAETPDPAPAFTPRPTTASPRPDRQRRRGSPRRPVARLTGVALLGALVAAAGAASLGETQSYGKLTPQPPQAARPDLVERAARPSRSVEAPRQSARADGRPAARGKLRTRPLPSRVQVETTVLALVRARTLAGLVDPATSLLRTNVAAGCTLQARLRRFDCRVAGPGTPVWRIVVVAKPDGRTVIEWPASPLRNAG